MIKLNNQFVRIVFMVILLIIGVTLSIKTINIDSNKKEMYYKIVHIKYVQDIFDKLSKSAGDYELIPKLIIIESSKNNAYSSKDNIIVTTRLIEYVKKDKNQLAFVLSHEIAHEYLGHLLKQNESMQEFRNDEAQADKMGAFLMLKSGFNVCKGREYFKNLNKDYGDILNKAHPDNAYRYDQLNINCE